MGISTLFSKLSHPFRQLFLRERTAISREQLSLLLFCYLPVMLLGVLANIFGLTEPTDTFFLYTHSVLLVTAATFFFLYFRQKISIAYCLSAFTIIGQIIISIEMIFCALRPSPYYVMLIMANTVLLAMNTMVTIAAYLKRTTLLLGIATMAVYVTCSIISGDQLLKSFIVVFTIAFGFVSFVGVLLARSTNKLNRDNERMRKDEYELLHLLKLKKSEVKAFITLANTQYQQDGTKMLLDRLETKSKLNLINNVEEYLKHRSTELNTIAQAFPELTPSEREICRLILQGKKLGEICLILNKNESNINSQRANMRKKLGLKPTDNLQEQLEQRLDSIS